MKHISNVFMLAKSSLTPVFQTKRTSNSMLSLWLQLIKNLIRKVKLKNRGRENMGGT